MTKAQLEYAIKLDYEITQLKACRESWAKAVNLEGPIRLQDNAQNCFSASTEYVDFNVLKLSVLFAIDEKLARLQNNFDKV